MNIYKKVLICCSLAMLAVAVVSAKKPTKPPGIEDKNNTEFFVITGDVDSDEYAVEIGVDVKSHSSARLSIADHVLTDSSGVRQVPEEPFGGWYGKARVLKKNPGGSRFDYYFDVVECRDLDYADLEDLPIENPPVNPADLCRYRLIVVGGYYIRNENTVVFDAVGSTLVDYSKPAENNPVATGTASFILEPAQ